jgi:hypothetical protein
MPLRDRVGFAILADDEVTYFFGGSIAGHLRDYVSVDSVADTVECIPAVWGNTKRSNSIYASWNLSAPSIQNNEVVPVV